MFRYFCIFCFCFDYYACSIVECSCSLFISCDILGLEFCIRFTFIFIFLSLNSVSEMNRRIAHDKIESKKKKQLWEQVSSFVEHFVEVLNYGKSKHSPDTHTHTFIALAETNPCSLHFFSIILWHFFYFDFALKMIATRTFK